MTGYEPDMDDYIELTADDLEAHHLCCALGDKKHIEGVERKKAWLRERFAEGLVFRKLDVRGKVFIEHAPSELAWRPIHAPGWRTIHCLWVSGRFAGQGHGRALLQSCIDHTRAEGRAGVVVAVAQKKRPFLGDRKFFEKHGFVEADRADEWRLLAHRIDPSAQQPRFTSVMHTPGAADPTMTVLWNDQCPFNLHWSRQVQSDLEAAGHPTRLVEVTSAEEAQQLRSPLGAYSLEHQGRLLCHHLTTTKATQRLLEKNDLA